MDSTNSLAPGPPPTMYRPRRVVAAPRHRSADITGQEIQSEREPPAFSRRASEAASAASYGRGLQRNFAESGKAHGRSGGLLAGA